jgi:hypothetical protein
MHLMLVPGAELWPAFVPVALCYPTCHFFFWNSCNIHINIYIQTLWKTSAFRPLCPWVPNHRESGSRDSGCTHDASMEGGHHRLS